MYQLFSQPAQIYYQTIWQLSTAFSHFFAKLLQSLKTNWTYSRKVSHDTQQFLHLWVSASLWLRFCPFTAFSPENLWWSHAFSEDFGCFHLWIFHMPNPSCFCAAIRQTVPARVSTSILITSNPAFDAAMHQMLPANCHAAQESPTFTRKTSAVPVSFLPDRNSPENRSLHFPGL